MSIAQSATPGGLVHMGRRGRRTSTIVVTLVLILALVVVSALQRRPNDKSTDLFREGLAAVDAGRPHDARRIAEALAATPDGEQASVVLQGILRLRSNDPATALRFFSRARPEGPLRHALLLHTAEALYRVGQLHEAGRLLQLNVADRPQDAESHRWLGAVYYDLGIRNEAIAELEAAARLAPGDHRPYRLLGLILYDFQQYTEAARYYRRALELHGASDQPDIVRELAHCLLETRAFEEALAVLSQVDECPDVLVLRAEAEWSLGKLDAAERDVGSALHLDAEHSRGNLLRARMDLAAGEATVALERLRRARAAAPHDSAVCYELTNTLRQAGLESEADAELAALQELSQLHSRYVQLAEEAARTPADAGIRRQLADLCRRLGALSAAATWERAALACDHLHKKPSEVTVPSWPRN